MNQLLIPMYHRVLLPSHPNATSAFRRHLEDIIQQFPVVIPGQQLTAPLSVCLTFDDAYEDFYTHVYPLLRTFGLRAVLGIPTGYIEETVSETPAFPAPLCSWDMLREMVVSGHVIPASHSHTHPHLSRCRDLWEAECVASKQNLSTRLGVSVDTFIYPYGDMSRSLHRFIQSHYTYDMRIGGASNRSWRGQGGLLYRVDAEHWWPEGRSMNADELRRAKRRYWWNRVRGK